MWVSTAVGKEMGDNTNSEKSGQAKRLKPEGSETERQDLFWKQSQHVGCPRENTKRDLCSITTAAFLPVRQLEPSCWCSRMIDLFLLFICHGWSLQKFVIKVMMLLKFSHEVFREPDFRFNDHLCWFFFVCLLTFYVFIIAFPLSFLCFFCILFLASWVKCQICLC